MVRRSKKYKPGKEPGDILEQLPLDIMSKIFLLLPTKTIISCASVCKGWRNLILNEPSFAQMHLRRLYQNPVTLFILSHSYNERLMVELAKTIYTSPRNISAPYSSHVTYGYGKLELAGSCNGLICLVDESNSYFVWNPIIKQSVILPPPKLELTCKWVFGFGFCSETNQYMVIRIVKYSKSKLVPCEIYTLGSNSWRSIGDVPIPYIYPSVIGDGPHSVHCNGSIYWLTEEPEESLCAFKISNEKLQKLPLPLQLPANAVQNADLVLQVLNNHVAVSYNCFGSINIWLMKDCDGNLSWSKDWSIPLRGLDRFELSTPIEVLTDKKLVLICGMYRLGCFDSEKNLLTKRKICGFPESLDQVVTHVASLISPRDAMKGMANHRV